MPPDRRDTAAAPLDWVLVANAARARCFLHDPANRALQELQRFAHPASRLAGTDLERDRGGQVRKSAASTQFAPHADPHDKQLEAFARTLAEHLEAAALAHQYRRVSLIASKALLGALRAQLGGATRALLGPCIGRDLTAWDGTALEHRVAEALEAAAGDQP